MKIYNSILYFILDSPPLTRDVTCSKFYLFGKIWGGNVKRTSSVSQFIRILWKSSKKIKKGVDSRIEPCRAPQKTEHGLDKVSFTLTVWALANKYLYTIPVQYLLNRMALVLPKKIRISYSIKCFKQINKQCRP